MKNETLVRWRRRAVEANALANRFQTPFAKRGMMHVAATYKQLARRAAKRLQATIFSPKPRRRQGDLSAVQALPASPREMRRSWQKPPHLRAAAIVPMPEQTPDQLEAVQREQDDRLRTMTGIKFIWPLQREQWLRNCTSLPPRGAQACNRKGE